LGSAEATALAVHRLLGLRDLSRTDAIVTEDGTVHVLEVNVTPGLTETSLLPTAAEAAGERLGSLFSVLIDNAVRRG
jgi:D-alanine-D-alanine ligase